MRLHKHAYKLVCYMLKTMMLVVYPTVTSLTCMCEVVGRDLIRAVKQTFTDVACYYMTRALLQALRTHLNIYNTCYDIL
jgi:hypothetical protein